LSDVQEILYPAHGATFKLAGKVDFSCH